MKTYPKYLESKNLASSTVKRYYHYLLAFIDWCDKNKIEAENTCHNDLVKYIEHLKNQHFKQKTIQTNLIALTHYFNWLIASEAIITNPVLPIKFRIPRERELYKPIDRQQLDKLYHHFESAFEDRHDKIMAGLIVFQGFDNGSLKRLKISDVKLREGSIYIAGGRRVNERTLKLQPEQIFELMEYLNRYRPQNTDPKLEDYFFPLTDGQMNHAIKEVILQLQEINPSIASSRHIKVSVITSWIKHHNLREAQYRAGHRYVSSTEAYLQNDITDLQLDIDKLHPLS